MEMLEFGILRDRQEKKFTASIEYEKVSKIFRTGDFIYTAVAVARSTGRW
jgi:hypothetical protein